MVEKINYFSLLIQGIENEFAHKLAIYKAYYEAVENNGVAFTVDDTLLFNLAELLVNNIEHINEFGIDEDKLEIITEDVKEFIEVINEGDKVGEFNYVLLGLLIAKELVHNEYYQKLLVDGEGKHIYYVIR